MDDFNRSTCEGTLLDLGKGEVPKRHCSALCRMRRGVDRSDRANLFDSVLEKRGIKIAFRCDPEGNDFHHFGYAVRRTSVGVERFELSTSRTRTVRSTGLSHTPIADGIIYPLPMLWQATFA